VSTPTATGRPFRRGDIVRLVRNHPLLGVSQDEVNAVAARLGLGQANSSSGAIRLPASPPMPELVDPVKGARYRQALRLGLGVHGMGARVRRLVSSSRDTYRLDRSAAVNAAVLRDAAALDSSADMSRTLGTSGSGSHSSEVSEDVT